MPKAWKVAQSAKICPIWSHWQWQTRWGDGGAWQWCVGVPERWMLSLLKRHLCSLLWIRILFGSDIWAKNIRCFLNYRNFLWCFCNFFINYKQFLFRASQFRGTIGKMISFNVAFLVGSFCCHLNFVTFFCWIESLLQFK